MTADAYLIVVCDGPDCPAPEAHWPVRFEPHTHRELRRLLKAKRGWRRTRDGRDFCPDCDGEASDSAPLAPSRGLAGAWGASGPSSGRGEPGGAEAQRGVQRGYAGNGGA